MRCNPGKWLLWAPVALLPLLGALWISRPSVEQQLADAAKANLSQVKADWAKVSVEGRDALIEGDAKTPHQVTEEWTFARETRSSDPNWTLVSTASHS